MSHKVTASHHAVARAQKRIPFLADRTHGEAARYCCLHAMAALESGRRAKNMPRWCVGGTRPEFSRRRKVKAVHGVVRYVWDADETMVMVVKKISVANVVGANWLLLTVVVPGTDRRPSYSEQPT